ncbi:MAG: thioredoxin family protein [Firmicutes bacterium]|nr:thioredoxin family protein [Bacillota bacterium]
MNIKVLGTGCPRCSKVEQLVREVVEEEGLDAKIEKVGDPNEIISYGVMVTPALVVDEKVMFIGMVPTKGRLKEVLTSGKSS